MSQSVKVIFNKELENIKQQWNEFVINHPSGNYFQSYDMFRVYNATRNYEPVFTGIVNNGEIIGGMLAVIQKEPADIFGKFTSRSVIWGGPLIKEDDPNAISTVLNTYNERISSNAIYSEFRNLWELSEIELQGFREAGYDYHEHLDIIHDLTIPVDVQLMNMHSGRRKNIRRAKRDGLKFSEITDSGGFESCLDLVRETYKQVKLPLPDVSFFKSSFSIMYEKGTLKVFAVIWHGKIIGSRLVLCFKDMIYDWYAGSDSDYLDKYPNDYLPWKIMEWGSNNGYKKFDFGGAGKPDVPYGVRNYKLKFGGKLVEFGRNKLIHKPIVYKAAETGFKVLRKIR